MDARQIQDELRLRFGWRVGPHTAAYVAARMAAKGTGAAAGKAIPVLAADARTGRAISRHLDPKDLAEPAGADTLF